MQSYAVGLMLLTNDFDTDTLTTNYTV